MKLLLTGREWSELGSRDIDGKADRPSEREPASQWLADLQLYDYRHRLYNPDNGRFLQTDPTGFDAGDMNLFRYCDDDPLDRSDPDGLMDRSASGSTIEERLRLFYGDNPGRVSLSGLDHREVGVSFSLALISQSPTTLDSRLQHFNIPGAIGQLEGAIDRYRKSEISKNYPDPQKVVDAIKKALREGRIRVGQRSDFRKDNPVSSRNNVILVDATARVNYRDFPSALAHDGEHIADSVHENDKEFLRERRAYNVEYGFGLLTGSTRPRVTDDEIRTFLKIP